jgi:hypothetical protein
MFQIVAGAPALQTPLPAVAGLPGDQLKEYAALAVLLPFAIYYLIRVIEALRKEELTDDGRKNVASAACFVATLFLAYRQGFLNLDYHDTGAVLAAFAVITTVAHNVYDKVMHPLKRLLRSKTRAARRSGERRRDERRTKTEQMLVPGNKNEEL